MYACVPMHAAQQYHILRLSQATRRPVQTVWRRRWDLCCLIYMSLHLSLFTVKRMFILFLDASLQHLSPFISANGLTISINIDFDMYRTHNIVFSALEAVEPQTWHIYFHIEFILSACLSIPFAYAYHEDFRCFCSCPGFSCFLFPFFFSSVSCVRRNVNAAIVSINKIYRFLCNCLIVQFIVERVLCV